MTDVSATPAKTGPWPHPSADRDVRAVALDRCTGRWYALNGTALRLWEQWLRHRDAAAVVGVLRGRYPEVDVDRLTEDVRATAALVGDADLVVAEVGGGEAPAGARMAAGTAPEVVLRRRERCRAWLAFGLALVLLRLPFGRMTALLRWCTTWSRRWPTAAEAAAGAAAVHRCGTAHPGRAACLEMSLGLFLTFAFAGLRARWCLGAAADPYRFHAWVETAEGPVRIPGDEPPEAYTTVLMV